MSNDDINDLNITVHLDNILRQTLPVHALYDGVRA